MINQVEQNGKNELEALVAGAQIFDTVNCTYGNLNDLGNMNCDCYTGCFGNCVCQQSCDPGPCYTSLGIYPDNLYNV